MSEQDPKSRAAEDSEEAGKLGDEFIPDNALPLCPNCLEPCDPQQNYCERCGSNEVVNPLASYMPFVRIRFNIGMVAKAWRKMLYDKESSTIFRLVCLFVIILFALTLCC